MKDTTIYQTAFQMYKTVGLDPLPIPYRDGHPVKGPTEAGWPSKAANGEYTDLDFAAPCNIGILLGGPKNVTDIDCDSPEAVMVAVDVMNGFMNKHGRTMVFGRESKPHSHYIFF